jgi:hypothetical protein
MKRYKFGIVSYLGSDDRASQDHALKSPTTNFSLTSLYWVEFEKKRKKLV